FSSFLPFSLVSDGLVGRLDRSTISSIPFSLHPTVIYWISIDTRMEVDEDEITQRETESYHSLRTSLSLEDLHTALHHSTSRCATAVSLTRIVDAPDRWKEFLGDTATVREGLAGLPQQNRPDSDTVQRALETVIANIRDENAEPSLSTARRHSFQLNDGDTFTLEVPSANLDQYDDPWAPPNTIVDEISLRADCTTTCSTMDSISPSASRERMAAEVGEYLLIKGGAWHLNVNDSVRVEMTTPEGKKGRSRSRSPLRVESTTTCPWEESGREIRDGGR
ncbi:hypothetical protein PMAYCL1PPCAC_22493, partial [Pristionchus mayeri]